MASAPHRRTFRVLGDSKAGGHSRPESGQVPGGRDISAEKLVRQAGLGSGEDCGQQGIRCYYVTLL